MDEYIDHWHIHKTEYDYVDYFNDWRKQNLTDIVEKDYNHPCVVIYSTGNEVSETAQEKSIAPAKEMTGLLYGLDPTRPVTCGVNIFFNLLSTVGFDVYSDDKAKKEAEKAERKNGRETGPKRKRRRAAFSHGVGWTAAGSGHLDLIGPPSEGNARGKRFKPKRRMCVLCKNVTFYLRH